MTTTYWLWDVKRAPGVDDTRVVVIYRPSTHGGLPSYLCSLRGAWKLLVQPLYTCPYSSFADVVEGATQTVLKLASPAELRVLVHHKQLVKAHKGSKLVSVRQLLVGLQRMEMVTPGMQESFRTMLATGTRHLHQISSLQVDGGRCARRDWVPHPSYHPSLHSPTTSHPLHCTSHAPSPWSGVQCHSWHLSTLTHTQPHTHHASAPCRQPSLKLPSCPPPLNPPCLASPHSPSPPMTSRPGSLASARGLPTWHQAQPSKTSWTGSSECGRGRGGQ